MVLIPPGTFQMGSPDTEPGRTTARETPQHSVTLSAGFYMGNFPVTQDLYTSVMGSNPSYFSVANSREPADNEVAGKRPVEMVSWYDALVFCNKLSVQEGLNPIYSISGSTDPTLWGDVPATANDPTWDAVSKVSGANGYRLPTEAEWEYACRAGKGTAFNCGTATPTDTSGYDAIVAPLGWYTANSGDTTLTGAEYTASMKTHEVGKKAANAWGLYDMHGNVYEWCGDWYNASYYSEAGAGADPAGPAAGSYRVSRGGYWYDAARYLRSAFRSYYFPWDRFDYIGFRLVRPAGG
jgi:formylglycine-generating enzyme required for sulfatase activity